MSDDLLAKAKAKLDRELLDIESRPDLSDDKKVDQIIVIFSTACAAIAIQPIPFADFFILTPLQAYMGARLAAIRGVPLSEAQAAEIVKEIMGVVGMGLVAQQAGIAAAKIFFPIVGGVATLPVVFGLTYAIGKVMDFYLLNKAAGRAPNAAEIKAAWRQAAIEGKSTAESQPSKPHDYLGLSDKYKDKDDLINYSGKSLRILIVILAILSFPALIFIFSVSYFIN